MNDLPPPIPEPPQSPPSFAAPDVPPPGPPGETLNPWLSIWVKPRATMRQILDGNPRRMVHRLAILGGLCEVIGSHLPEMPPFTHLSIGTVLAFKACLGIVGGLIGLYLGSAMVLMTGRWLGGRGTFVGMRAAGAWSSIPAIWGALLWLPLIAYLGVEALNVDPKTLLDDPTGLLLLVPVGLIGVILVFWRLVVYCKCVGEVHGFSAWHAFGALLIACVLLAIPIVLLVGVAIGFAGLAALSS